MAKTKVFRKRALPPLEIRFEFLGDDATPGGRKTLRAAQYEVLDRSSGQERSLKLWRKTGTGVDDDLRQLWLHEMRQVQRVMSYAGARDIIVDILEFVEDQDDFGVLLETAGQPLSVKLQHVSRQHWLKNIAAPRPRVLLWQNLRRVCEALGIVHSQGLVHGRLTAETVMTEGADVPDFLLTGFEWSLWLTADSADKAQAKLGATSETIRADRYSFAEDWRALGRIAALCLNARVASSGEIRSAGKSDTPIALSTSEIVLLKRLLNPTRLDNLDAISIARAIGDILNEVGRESTSRSGTFILMFSNTSGLGEAVYDATGGAIAVDETRSQLNWIRADLDTGVRLLMPRDFDPARSQPRLVTETMTYLLSPMRQEGAYAWDVAVCMRIEMRQDNLRIGDVEEFDVVQPIEVTTSVRHSVDTRARLGPDALDWSAFAHANESHGDLNRDDLVRQSLVLVQVVESVIKALEIYPVQILATEVRHGRRYAIIRAEPESERDRVARRIGLIESAAALRRLFEDDQRQSEEKWRLSQAASLGASRLGDVAASFADVEDHRGRHSYLFEIDDEVQGAGPWFLRTERDAGTEGQIARRLRNIKALKDRVDLAEMLNDPWRVRRDSRDRLSDKQREDPHFKALDEPKQNALAGL